MNTVFAVDDDRGRLAGLGAVLLALFVALLITRFDWAIGIETIITGVAAAAVLGPAAALAPREGPPPGWLSAVLVAGFTLMVGSLINLADLLGADTGEFGSGTLVWVGLLLALTFAVLSQRRDSAICTLLAAGAAVVAVAAAVDWIFSPDGVTTFRWVFLIEGLLLFGAGSALYGARGRHGVVLVVLSGIAILAIGFTFLGLAFTFDTESGDVEGISAWWELVTLFFGLALAAFAAHTREPGPGYAGAVLLIVFAGMANTGVEEKFLGWPLVLLLLTGVVIAAYLRGVSPMAGTRGGGGAPPAETTREVTL